MPRKHHYGATAISNFHDLGVGCQGHLRSNVKKGIESSYMVSYLLLIVTIYLGRTIKVLQLFSNYRDLGVGGQGHLRSNIKVEVESSHVVSYLLVIVTICLGSITKELQHFETIMTLV